MAPVLSLAHQAIHLSSTFLFFKSTVSSYTPRLPKVRYQPKFQCFTVILAQNGSVQSDNFSYRYSSSPPPAQEPRTLFPVGYKRPEIKVPSIVLQLNADEVLNDGSVLDVVDSAVSKSVGIVVVNGSEGGGGKLYKAACLLNSVIRDRAYFLVAERVDIAAAVNASGVVVSNEGLPAMVARNMLMDSKSESVILPVVGKIVQTVDAAVRASDSEGADFLIFCTDEEEQNGDLVMSIYQNIKIPVFIATNVMETAVSFTGASKLLRLGASGLAVTLQEFGLFTADKLDNLLNGTSVMNTTSPTEARDFSKLEDSSTVDGSAGQRGIAGFVMVEDREVQFKKKKEGKTYTT